MINIHDDFMHNFGDDDSGNETEEYIDDGDTEDELEEKDEEEGETDL